MEHSHTSKIVEWKLDENTNYVAGLYGCTDCDVTSVEPLSNGHKSIEHDHDRYVDGCFSCKIQTLELNTGDANSNKAMSSKRWNGELDAYSDARRQGIQPAGTSMKHVEEAHKASETLGRAYNSEVDPAAKTIDKSTANVMKEVGL
jgi:hypothetical protein